MGMTAAETQTPTGYLELIRENADFRSLWIGQIVSLLGDWFNMVASAALVAKLTGSELAVGGLFAVRMLAPFVISPFAGVAADRYNRKHVLILADLARAVTVLGFLLVRHPSQVWLLYVLTAIQLGISGFFFPARNAILPDIVSPRAIGAANAIGSVTWSVMLAFGAAAGGIVSGVWGIYPAFVIDAITFLVSAFFIGQIRLGPAAGPAQSPSSIAAALGQYGEALEYLRRHADTLFVALHKAALAVCFGATLQVVQVAIATRIFPLGKESGLSLGFLFGILGVGTGIGPILARRFTGDESRRLRAAILLAYFTGAAGLAVTAPLWNLAAVLAGTLCCGVGNGMIWVFSTQLLLQSVPGMMRGRVFATELAFFTLMAAAGPAVAGMALESPLGITGVLWSMSGLTLLPAALWGLWLALGD
ncbi:MAG: MFS transporter [Pirellulales bacterium]|nr:MFS transporter [Pirellulales bacterium]